jgi:hypothetical protein
MFIALPTPLRGNVNSALEIFHLITEKEKGQTDGPSSAFLDETSYEYLITILSIIRNPQSSSVNFELFESLLIC